MVVLFILYLNTISAQCSSRLSQPPLQFHVKNEVLRVSLSILFGIITGLVSAFLFALLVRCFIKYINRTPILKGPVVFSLRIPSKTLKSAFSDEPQLLGSGPSGKYYKAVLDNGLAVAVKRLELFESKATNRKIQQELKALSCLRHRNLMSLRAYVRESRGYSLVYDYVPTGSLEDVTRRARESGLQLKWEIRLRIAVGIVRGLHYLHFTCDPKRMHYNLKPSNVILDAEFKPRLADCGLAAVIPNFYRAASGYNAPECIQNCRYTDKSDVFSFGAILGVLLTGRDPLEFFGEAGSGGSMGQWLRHLQQVGEAREALDKSILGEEMEEGEMLMAVRIAVVCLSDMPADRPSSDELVSMLTQLNSF
ncbi:inactive leucine-rich repeat receptor-like protein kinase CORYNE [Dorcoceras hygrometricum]|uniref:Inactive leucine-rich repeat receptor-like protein kinase CORYNE n=1 Tax=Dorcoceras hygrometricum TaxID=472368 RepID=A0A2Z7CHV7_9LAMI|nr:inactive leucine-rich repeat receptor-like protein kinase CORYNE [Dorcoceras hygrometricum]